MTQEQIRETERVIGAQQDIDQIARLRAELAQEIDRGDVRRALKHLRGLRLGRSSFTIDDFSAYTGL